MIEPLPAETLAWLHRVADAGYAQPMVLRHVMQRLDALESDRAQELRASHAYNEAVVEETVRRLQNLEIAHQQLQQQQFLAHLNTPLTEADRKDLGLPSAELDDNDEAAHQQPADHVPVATEMVTTPESAPVATDDELLNEWRTHGDRTTALRAVYNLGRQHGAAQPQADQPAPEAAPVTAHAELLAIRSWLSHRPVLDGDLGEPGRQHGAAQPAPPPAPFKELVKRVATAMHPNFPGAFEDEARAAIHETLLTVAAWLDLEGYVRAANDLREEVVE